MVHEFKHGCHSTKPQFTLILNQVAIVYQNNVGVK
jgi:hypothetical protein